MLNIFSIVAGVTVGPGPEVDVDHSITGSRAGPTLVSGLIAGDTVWTPAGSPYHIVDNATLKHDARLTIKAGTVVKFENFTSLTIKGSAEVEGTGSNRVVFTSLGTLYKYSHKYYDVSTGVYKYFNGTGKYYGISTYGGIFNATYAVFENSTILGIRTYGHIKDSIFRNNEYGISDGSGTIERCTFINNYQAVSFSGTDISYSSFKDNFYGAIVKNERIYDSTLINNTIAVKLTGTGQCYNSTFYDNIYGVTLADESVLRYNRIYQNYIGIRTNVRSEYSAIQKNNIFNNTIGIQFENMYHVTSHNINFNNIYDGGSYNLNYSGAENVNVSRNWWGTTKTADIDDGIFDVWDDHTLGEVFYKPVLTSPVNIIDKKPTAEAGFDKNVNVNAYTEFDSSGSFDPDGDALTFRWDFGDGFVTNWVPYEKTNHIYYEPGNYTVTLTVSDGYLRDTDTLRVTVKDEGQNRPPVPDAGPDHSVVVNQSVTFNASGSYDPDGDPLRYQWLFGDGMESDWQDLPEISHAYISAGTYAVTVKVHDGSFYMTDSCIVYVAKPDGNLAPIANAGTIQNVFVNNTVYFNGSGSYDPDDDQLQFKWDFGDGNFTGWRTDNSTMHIYTVEGIYEVTLTVSDGELNDTDTTVVEVKKKVIKLENRPPEFLSTPNLIAIEGIEWTYEPEVVDPDGNDTVILDLAEGPYGMKFESGILGWTPGKFQEGMNRVRLLATDLKTVVFQEFNITVYPSSKPVINTTPPEIIKTDPADNSLNIPVNNSTIEIIFSKSMNISSVEKSLSISPDSEYSIYWSGNDTVMLIVFSSALVHNTTYFITIDSSSQDVYGINLEQLFDLVFITEKDDEKIDDKPAVNGQDSESQSSSRAIYIVSVVAFIIILILMLLLFSVLRPGSRKRDLIGEDITAELDERREPERAIPGESLERPGRESTEPDEAINDLKNEVLVSEKPSDFDVTTRTMLGEFKKKYEKGELSQKTYDSVVEILKK